MPLRTALQSRLLTVAATARRLRVRETTIHELVALGIIRAYRFNPHVVRADRRDVERLI